VEPGFVAFTALFAIIAFGAVAFRRKPPLEAALLTYFGTVLFGPMSVLVKLPLMPPLGKEAFACITIFVALAVKRPSWLRRAARRPSTTLLPAIAFIGCIATSLANTDSFTTVVVRAIFSPGMTLKDGLAMAATSLVGVGLPVLVGASLVRSARDLHTVIRYLAMFGLVYAPFALLEVRLSPQLHAWIYGYFAHGDFSQTMRFGGYRPMVFMQHGLAVALFFVVATLAASALPPRERLWRFPARRCAVFLVFVVLVCKSVGAIAYAFALAPLVLWFPPKRQIQAAALIAAIVFIYPAMRANDLFPVDRMLAIAHDIDGDRAVSSLFTRFHAEELMLTRARERFLLGWGSYGRGFVITGEGPNGAVVVDGAWVLILSGQGIIGLIAELGVLLVPIFLALSRFKRIPLKMRTDVAVMALIVAITSLDLVPNGRFAGYPHFLAGVLAAAIGIALERERESARASVPILEPATP